jgi:hypothetical protein
MKTRVAVVLVLLLGVLAGCRQAPLDPGFPTPDPGRPMPPSPAQVAYQAPEGFVEFYDYAAGNNLFPAPAIEVWIPSDAVGSFDNLEAIAVYSYIMNIDVSGWPEDRLAELVRRLVAHVGSPVVEPERTTVAGRTAFTLPVTEYAPAADLNLTYRATFIFDGVYLVQTQCQYELRQELIEQTCADLHNSMEITIV